MTTLSSIPPRPPSSSTLMIRRLGEFPIEEEWILLHRPATLDVAEFEQALSDLEVTGMLLHRLINGNVYVRWLQ